MNEDLLPYSEFVSSITNAADEDSLIVALSNLDRAFTNNTPYYMSIGKNKIMEICNKRRKMMDPSWSSRVSYKYGLVLQLFVDVENARY